MKSRFVEITRFLKHLKQDYKTFTIHIPKKGKYACFKRILGLFFWTIWNAISTLFVYPIWYLFRKKITGQIYKGTSWEEIETLMDENKVSEIKTKLKRNGLLYYWLWTYGDCHDPLGWGGMPTDYGSKKNSFANRYKYSAIRNPRFNINYMYFKTGFITTTLTVIDTRNLSYLHKSYGIGDSPDGIYFKWMKDNNEKWFFIYEDNNTNHIFYFGYVGLLHNEIGKRGRFEMAYRKTQSSFTNNGTA